MKIRNLIFGAFIVVSSLSPDLELIEESLNKNVDETGLVNYTAINTNNEISAYVMKIKTLDLKSFKTENEEKTFFINTYNLLVIHGILNELKKHSDYKGVGSSLYEFFNKKKYRIGKKKYSLNKIEHNILRKKFKDPRIHFALVCAATSCPPLKNSLYTSVHLDAELDKAAEVFINSSKGLKLDKEKNTLWLSSIFKWYEDDFGKKKPALIKYILKYINDKDSIEYIETNLKKIRIKYLEYKWDLNKQ